MTGEKKRVISELAIFAEAHLQAIEEINQNILRLEDDVARCTNEDDRGAMLLLRHEWQCNLAILEKKLEELRRTAAANEPFADPF